MLKDRAEILKAMLRTSYREPIEKVIGYYIEKKANEMMESCTFNGVCLSECEPWMISTVFQQLCLTPNFKEELISAIDKLKVTDVCEELMKSYGIATGDEKTFIHDEMSMFYREVACDLKNRIMLGIYK
jgi:hypothetical protein